MLKINSFIHTEKLNESEENIFCDMLIVQVNWCTASKAKYIKINNKWFESVDNN